MLIWVKAPDYKSKYLSPVISFASNRRMNFNKILITVVVASFMERTNNISGLLGKSSVEH
jgi:hypothetical protein